MVIHKEHGIYVAHSIVQIAHALMHMWSNAPSLGYSPCNNSIRLLTLGTYDVYKAFHTLVLAFHMFRHAYEQKLHCSNMTCSNVYKPILKSMWKL